MLAWLVLPLCLAVGFLQPTTMPATRPAVDAVDLARRAVDALRAGDAEAFATLVDANVRRAAPSDQVRRIAAELTRRHGRFLAYETPVRGVERGLEVVTLPAVFERARVTFKVGVDPMNGLASGLLIVGLTPRGEAVAPPPYADPALFREVEVVVRTPRRDGAGNVELPGTLSLPTDSAGPAPGVVLVHGSGPLDRNAGVGATQIFRDLAQGLASRGVAVLRYDKRTLVAPDAVDLTENSLDDETIADAASALLLLAARPEVDAARLFVVGHSLGAMLAPRVIERADADVAGLVLLAAPARPTLDVVLEQIDYLARFDGQIDPAERAALDAATGAAARARAGLDASLLGAPATYWRQLDAVRPTDELVAALEDRSPLRALVLRGGRDYQVTAADEARWRAALLGRDDTTFRQYPALNHVFVAGQGRPGPGEYERFGHVDQQVIDDIAAWVKTGELPPPPVVAVPPPLP